MPWNAPTWAAALQDKYSHWTDEIPAPGSGITDLEMGNVKPALHASAWADTKHLCDTDDRFESAAILDCPQSDLVAADSLERYFPGLLPGENCRIVARVVWKVLLAREPFILYLHGAIED